MEQILPCTGLNDPEHVIVRRVTGRHPRSQVQIASSTSPATDLHERFGIRFVAMSYLADARRFSGQSHVQMSMRSEVFALLKTGQNRNRTSNSPRARAVALSAIDEELDAARRLAYSLRSRRNALASISFLPAELLSRIFHFRAREDTPWPAMGKYSWTAIAHVCQRWRQVSLNDSSLWARLKGNRPSLEWISEVLVRARNAPLHIDFMGAPRPGALSKLRSHISHTRELRLHHLSIFHPHGVQEICASEAPILEHFELGSLDGYPATFLPPAGTKLFNGWAPNLRTFTLSQVSIPCSLIPCGQLTQLKITYRQISPAEPSSSYDLGLNHLIDLLINNPGLEVLILEFCLPTILSQVSNRQSVHLPRLSRLCLSGSTSRVTNLFKRLTLPPSATLRLRCISENLSAHPDHLILPHVSTHLYNLAPAEIKSFRVTTDWSGGLVELATSISTPKSTTYDTYVIERHMNSEADLILSFNGMPNFRPSIQADILRRACSILPISNIEVLSIFTPDTIESVNWYELFQHCKKVTTIKARARGTTSLLQALAPPKRNNTAARSQAVNNPVAAHATTTPFPELTSLLLESLKFDYYVSGSGALYDVTVDVLRRRQANKTHLKTLHVDGCVITPERANSLKEHAQEFHWDEDEGEGYFDPWEDYDYCSGY